MLLKNNIEILIRKAEKSDAKEILDYLKIVGGESDNLLFSAEGLDISIEQEEKIIENINSTKLSAIFVGIIDNKIVCVGGINTPTKKRISHHGEIALSVLKEFWGIGVATALISEIINFAKQTKEIKLLHLGVKRDNLSGINLYKKMGFTEFGIHPKFFNINGVYFDKILMSLEI